MISVRKAYYRIFLSPGIPCNHSLSSKIIAFLVFIILNIRAFSQEYDEIAVFLDVPHVGGIRMTSVISGTDLFLPVTDLFDFLRIRNIPEQDLESVSGFFILPEAAFLISRKENT